MRHGFHSLKHKKLELKVSGVCVCVRTGYQPDKKSQIRVKSSDSGETVCDEGRKRLPEAAVCLSLSPRV